MGSSHGVVIKTLEFSGNNRPESGTIQLVWYSDYYSIVTVKVTAYRMAINECMCKWEIWYELYNDIAMTLDEWN